MLVSVIIPCWNVDAYLADAIESVMAQTYQPLEIILVDNNSQDKTWEIISSYCKDYPDFIFGCQVAKQGAPAARNKGLSLAKGEWVQFLDADDILLPEKIKNQVKLIDISDQKHVAFVAGSCTYLAINGKESSRIPEENKWLGLMKGSLGNTCNNLWNKKYIEKAGRWNEGLQSSQEYELMFRLLKENETILTDFEKNTIVRQRKGSISVTNFNENEEIAGRLRLDIYKYLIEEKSSLVKGNNDFLLVLLQFLARLGNHDPILAREAFNTYFPNDFKIINSSIGRFYTYCFNYLGFERAQFFYKNYLKMRLFLAGKL